MTSSSGIARSGSLRQFFGLLILAVAVRLAWMGFTNYTYEDAFITFRYARNLSQGLGFVYNANQFIYGTTTPLFTLGLAVWAALLPNALIEGARLLGLIAALVTLITVWSFLGHLPIPPAGRVATVLILATSDKLWERDTGGMETPIVICLMIITYYTLSRQWAIRAGLVAGLLLWTRVDTVMWVFAIAMTATYLNRRLLFPFLLTTALTYLPWILFATWYFGTPIPHTIIAKWIAYVVVGHPPGWGNRLLSVLQWMTPATIPADWRVSQIMGGSVTLAIAAWGWFKARHIRWLIALPVFGVAEVARLVLTQTTFEPRYFVPLYWVVLLLLGLGAGAIWTRLSSLAVYIRIISCGFLVSALALNFGLAMARAYVIRDYQFYVYNSSLKPAGLWLKQNTPETATVLLEPLGYAGYYAEREMLDEVGLVSPAIVELKRTGTTNLFQIALALKPHYLLAHCDDAFREQTNHAAGQQSFTQAYQQVATFNPLHFDATNTTTPPDFNFFRLQRNACYQLWKSIDAP